MFAGGINSILLPLLGSQKDFTAINLGLIGAAWAIGYVSGCLLVPHIVQRVGHIRSFSVLAALAAITILACQLVIHPGVWIPGRAVSGFCFSGAAMIVESWLNEQTEAKHRGQVFGFYTMVNLGATTAGTMAISFGSLAGPLFFILSAIFYCLALLPTALTSTRAPRPLTQANLNLAALWRNSPVAVAGAVLIGVTNGAFGTLGPVYAERIDLGTGAVALFMSLSLLTGALIQMPVGFLSDRIDRRAILIAQAAVAAACELYLAGWRPQGSTENLVAGALLGSVLYSMYPVIVAHANDRAEPETFLQISGGLLLLFGIGAIAGPFIAGVAMATGHPSTLFLTTCVAHLAIAIYALMRMFTRDATDLKEKSGFVSVMPARLTTPETALMDPRAPDAGGGPAN